MKIKEKKQKKGQKKKITNTKLESRRLHTSSHHGEATMIIQMLPWKTMFGSDDPNLFFTNIYIFLKLPKNL